MKGVIFCKDSTDSWCEERKTIERKQSKLSIFLFSISASLIRTIIGGAQIIDLMILVIDIVKGMQTQTAECLVIGEITCSKMMVVLNKVDLLKNNEAAIQKMTKKMTATLSKTKFKDAPIVTVSAQDSTGIEPLIEKVTFINHVDVNVKSNEKLEWLNI